MGFGSRDETARKQHLLRMSRADELDQAAECGPGHAIAQGARNRHAERRFRRRDAQVTRSGDCAASAHRKALDLRDCGLCDAFEPVEDVRDMPFVLHAVGWRLEPLKLRDVGSGHERLSSSAAQDEHVHAVIAIDAFARGDERVVHAPRHRISRLRTIECHERNRGLDVKEGLSCSHA